MEHYFTNNEELKSELRLIQYKQCEQEFYFYSDNGVFSKNKIDFGSRLLVDTILENKEEINSLLDVGCGYGFIGITLAKLLHAKATLIDVNKRAIHLTKMNGKKNDVDLCAMVSNIYENIDEQYDLIVTNPPIRAGKSVVLEILKDAKKYLKENGTLWFVIRKDQGAKSILKELENLYKIEILKKVKGFYIFRAKTY